MSDGPVPEVADNATPFRAMAARIDLNLCEGFSGAACIVPPGAGSTVELLLLRNTQDAVAFWSLIRTHADIAITELSRAEAEQQAWGRR